MRASMFAALLGGLLVQGCTNSTDDAELLAPPAEGEGVQYQMVSTLGAGVEIERCQMFRAPAEGLTYDSSDVRYSAGSHHVLLFETEYTEVPTEDENGLAVNPLEVHDCAEGAPERWSVVRVVGGSQNKDGSNALNELPPGVAMKVAPGTLMVMNTHYLNTSGGDLETDARINLYTVPPESVEQEAGILFFYNPFIHVPANGSARARMRCPVTQDITLLNVQSHMHKTAVNHVSSLARGGESTLETIYENTDWAEVPIGRFEGGLQLEAGDALDYQCDYDNPYDHDIAQGLTTKDEMCMLIGPYYPRNDDLEVCADEEGDYDAMWIGDGAADCGETYACIVEALDASDDDIVSRYSACVVNSCPGVARELSDLVQCQLSRGYGECDECDGDACVGCVIKACEPEAGVCGGAVCD